MFEVTYTCMRPMVREAMRRFLWHRHAVSLVVPVVALVLSVWTATYAEFRWLSGLLAGLILAWCRSLVIAYRGAIRDVEVFLPAPLALRLTDAGIEFDCDLVRSFSPWRAFPLVVSTARCDFLTRAGSAHTFVVPVAGVGAKAASFLLDRIREAGGEQGRTRPVGTPRGPGSRVDSLRRVFGTGTWFKSSAEGG